MVTDGDAVIGPGPDVDESAVEGVQAYVPPGPAPDAVSSTEAPKHTWPFGDAVAMITGMGCTTNAT